MDPNFYNWNKTLTLIITWHSLNNSVHLNLLHFELLSRESETEHHAAINMVDWSAPVIESIFSYLEVYMSSVV